MARRFHLFAAAFAALAATPSLAAERSPVVVELFTSQSCYSCPPAEAFLGELAKRPDVIALEFHVDYWNDLIYGLAGRWKDVHSSPAYTERQRRYAQTIRGGGVYTPQMVIDGAAEAVGSRTGEVERAIAAARAAVKDRPTVSVAARTGGLAVRITGAAPAQPTAVWLARYRVRETTQVKGGENRGKTLDNHHVVTALTAIGTWSGDSVAFEAPLTLAPGDGCVVMIQSADQGQILGAAPCPASLAPAG